MSWYGDLLQHCRDCRSLLEMPNADDDFIRCDDCQRAADEAKAEAAFDQMIDWQIDEAKERKWRSE